MKVYPPRTAFIRQVIVVVFSLMSISMFGQTNFGLHAGYEFLPSSYFSPSQDETFNPSLYKMESFVTYSHNTSPSVGVEMVHEIDRKSFFKLELDYIYNRAQYKVQNDRYGFLYEGDEGKLTLENHGLNVSILYGLSKYSRRAQKSKAIFYFGGVIGTNIHQKTTLPTSEFKDTYNYYFLNEDRINKIVYGAMFELNWKLRYKGRGRNSKYANIDFYSKIYAHGLIKPRDEQSAIFAPGIKLGFDL